MRTTRPFALAATAALLIVGCGGDDDALPAPEEPADEPAPEPVDEPAPEPVDGSAITIADFRFSGVTEVAVGTTVVVTNDDGTSHTWTSDDGAFDSGALGNGDSFEFTFTEPGEFAYHCNFHPSMQGTIVVTG